MDNDKKIFKAAQFLQDIGLMFGTPESLPPSQPAPATNLVIFRDPKVAFPDLAIPEYAAFLHIKNLVNTYGLQIVEEALVDVKKIAG